MASTLPDVENMTERPSASYSNVSTASVQKPRGERKIMVDLSKADHAAERRQIVSEFPEGGRRAWMTVAGAFLIQYTCFGYINSFGVYQDYYVRLYLTKFTPSDISWIGGVQIFLSLVMGAISGRFFDRGYFKYLIYASIVLHAIALFMLSLSHENSFYQVFLAQGITFGLASGLTYIPSLGIAGHYFNKRRSLAVGVISSGSALGAVLQPIMLNKLFNGPVGFHNGVRISAAVNVFLLIIAALIMKTRLAPKEVQHFPIRQWLLEPAYFTSMMSGFFVFLGSFFPVFYLQLFAIVHGVDKNFAFYSISILNAASFFGRIIPTYLGSRLGVFNLGTFFILGSGIIVFCLAAVHEEAGIAVFAVLFGLFSGASIALGPSATAHLAKDANEVGYRIGLSATMSGLGGLIATPIGGAILTSQYHWIRAIVFSGVCLVIGGSFFGLSRVFYGRGHSTWLV